MIDLPNSEDSPTSPISPQVAQANGESSALMLISLAQGVGGEEWKPVKGEKENLSAAFAAYYQAKGIPDLPPGVILVSALLAYTLPRLQKPVTKSKLMKLKKWIGSKFRRHKKEAEKTNE